MSLDALAPHSTLATLALQIASGAIRVVDLTQTLSRTFDDRHAAELGQSARFAWSAYPRYDSSGPAGTEQHLLRRTYRHAFRCAGSLVYGKDLPLNTVDTLPTSDMVAPAVVIDCSAEAAADANFLLTKDVVLAWEARFGRVPARSWVLMRTDWSKKSGRDYANLKEDGAHTGTRRGCHPLAGGRTGHTRIRNGKRSARMPDRPDISRRRIPPTIPARRRAVRAAMPGQSRPFCPHGALLVSAPLKIQNGSG